MTKYEKIRQIIDAWDPEAMIDPDFPQTKNEYWHLVKRITKQVTRKMTARQIAQIVADTMNRAFCSGYKIKKNNRGNWSRTRYVDPSTYRPYSPGLKRISKQIKEALCRSSATAGE